MMFAESKLCSENNLPGKDVSITITSRESMACGIVMNQCL